MIRLYTSFYKDPYLQRHLENLKCLEYNLKNPLIDEVHLLLDGPVRLPVHEKLRELHLDKRPTYNDFFEQANQHQPGISIISNTDIYFDESLAMAKDMLHETCYALTRWNIRGNGTAEHFGHSYSQDCWIFNGPIRPISGDFNLGKRGCDNRIAWEIRAAGYKVKNPSLSIKSYHLHLTGIRHYSTKGHEDQVPEPYLTIQPTSL